MEEQGVPTAVIVTTPFIASSKAMGVAQGIPEYPFVTIPHPIAATEKHILNEWVDESINEIVGILLSKQDS